MKLSFHGIKAKLQSPTSNLFWQLVRYGIAGGIAFVVDFAVLWLVTDVVGWHYLVGAACGYLVGLVITYLLSILWVFDQRRLSNKWAEFVGFALIGCVGLGLTQLFMYVFTEYVFVVSVFGADNYLYSKVITVILVAGINFILKKMLLFSKKRNKNQTKTVTL